MEVYIVESLSPVVGFATIYVSALYKMSSVPPSAVEHCVSHDSVTQLMSQ